MTAIEKRPSRPLFGIVKSMANETSITTGDYIPPPNPESPFAAVEHAALIEKFYETEGDPDIGRELSLRILAHAEFPGNPIATPLIGRDGMPVQQDGVSLSLADYVNFAVGHHFEAVESILDFLMMQKGSPDYDTMRAAIVARLNASQA